MNIPVFHDDQHGTAIISGAGLVNAVELVNKKMSDIKININGAGASAISCAKTFCHTGANQIIYYCDSKGVIYKGREEFNKQKKNLLLRPTVELLMILLMEQMFSLAFL